MLLKGLWGLYSCNKFNYFPPEYVWDEYPSIISILPYTWNKDVFRDKKISDALKSQIKSFYC